MLRSIWAARPTLSSLVSRNRPDPNAIVQHVRIKNRRRLRNAAIGAGVLYACWSVYFTRVLAPPLTKHLEEDGEPLFIPFPFSFKVVESKPYKGTDPEWQEYIRIARDVELLKKIRSDMLDTVLAAAETNPVLIHRCGKQMKVRRHWLDLDFPYRPPPTITRDGLMLFEEGLAYVSMEVDQTTMQRISRALWPAPVAISASTFLNTLFRQNMQNVARYFGFETEDPQPSRPLVAALKKRLEEVERRAAKEDGEAAVNKGRGVITAAGTSSASGGEADAANGTELQQPGKVTTAETRSPPPPSEDDLDKSLSAKDLIPFDSVRSSIDDAWDDFKKTLHQTWAPIRPQPPGGCVVVSGLVELQAKNSRIAIEVRAYWNPKTRKYDVPTMHMKLRSIRVLKQVPITGGSSSNSSQSW